MDREERTVGPGPGRRLGPDARRAQLVGVGLELLKEVAFDDVTAETVARAGGVSKALVFHYFPSTRDLQLAVLRAAAAELLVELDVGAGEPPDERLRLGLDAFVCYIEQQPATYQAVVRRAGSDERLMALFEDTRTAVVDIIAEALGLADAPAGVRLGIRGWIAMVEECVLHWLDDRPVPREDLVEFLRRAALGTVAASGALAP